MIACGDDIDAELEKLFGNLRGDTKAASRIFTIRNREIDAMLSLKFWQPFMNDVTSSAGEDVTDEEDAQRAALLDSILIFDGTTQPRVA
jgi:hypothetical protein